MHFVLVHANVPKSKHVWVSITTNLLHLTILVTKTMVLGPKINWDHFHHMYLFLDSSSYGFAIKVACVICWPHFFGHSWTTWPCYPQYKQKLFAHHCCCFICFMKRLNRVILHGIAFLWSYQGLGWQGAMLF
jgi:hypothetical protein